MVHEDGYMELAAAVVLRAITDFRKAAKEYKKGRNRKANLLVMKEVLEFIRSDRFKLYTDIPPEKVIQKLKEEIEDDI